MMPTIEPGTYYHYKDTSKLYEVLGVGRDTETDEPVVIYRPLYESDAAYWVRPYEMFVGMVDSDGKKTPRFSKASS